MAAGWSLQATAKEVHMSVSITWHGHATFSLAVDGTRIIIDPFLTDNPAAKSRADDVTADFMLLTHGHGDHTGDAVAVAKRTGALVIANFEICGWMSNQGHDNCHAMNTGGAFQFPFGRVKMTVALHSSSLPDGSYGGDPGGYVVWAGGKTIYIAGDTALFSDMQLIGRHGLDLAILPIGDNFTMGPEDSIDALAYLQPRQVIPAHYNTWPPIAVDVDTWARQVQQATACQPVVLTVDESYTL
jgi:L-ascorbate metabolism protein UlaG (beta-lactamase superfamily)